MDNFWSGVLSILAFLASIWTGLLIIYIANNVRKNMRAGHGIFGSGLEEVSVWIWAAVAANVALWAIFGWGSQQLEKGMKEYSTQSKAGAVAYSCLNDPKNNCFSWDYSSNNKESPAGNNAQTPTENDKTAESAGQQSVAGAITTAADGVSYITLPPSAFLTDPEVKACTASYWISIGGVGSFVNQDTTVFPADSSWTITAPGWFGHTFVGADNEKWSLVSTDYPDLSFTINENFATSLGGSTGLFSGKDKVTIKGTGPLPAPCARKEVVVTPTPSPAVSIPPVTPTPDPNTAATAVTTTTEGACYSVATLAANIRSSASTGDNTNITASVAQGTFVRITTTDNTWGTIVSTPYTGNFVHMSVLAPATGCP